MTGMVGELQLRAGRAAVEMPAFAGRATGKDGVDGAALFGRTRGVAVALEKFNEHFFGESGKVGKGECRFHASRFMLSERRHFCRLFG